MFRWLTARRAVATAYVLSVFMGSLDSQVVNVMLPTLSREFGQPVDVVSRAIIAYVLPMALVMPASAWLMARFGARRLFVIALLVFAGASVSCGLVTGLMPLLIARVAQGAAAGIMSPVAMALLYRTFPLGERARIVRLLLIPIALGPALAPPLGGLIVQYWSWRAAFFINVPLAAIAVTFLLLAAPRSARADRRPLGVVNLLAATVALSGLIILATEGPVISIANPLLWMLAGAVLVAFVIFVRIEIRSATPTLGLRLFADRSFRVTNIGTAGQAIAFTGGLFLVIPVMLQEGGGLDAAVAGAWMTIVPVAVVIASQTVGRLLERVGPRWLTLAGQSTVAVAFLVLALSAPRPSPVALAVGLALAGFGAGTVMVGLQVVMFSHLEGEDVDRGSTIVSVNRQISLGVGTAVVAAVIAAAGANAFGVSLAVMAVISAATAVNALFLPRRLVAAGPTRAVREGVVELRRP